MHNGHIILWIIICKNLGAKHHNYIYLRLYFNPNLMMAWRGHERIIKVVIRNYLSSRTLRQVKTLLKYDRDLEFEGNCGKEMMCGIIIVWVDQPSSFAWVRISNIGQLFMCVLFQFSLFYRLEGTWLWDYFDKTFTHVQVNTGQSIICSNLHANKINARNIIFIIV